MESSTKLIELIKQISYDTIQGQGYIKKFDAVVISVNSDNTIAEVRIMGYESTLSFPNKSNSLLVVGDSVKVESPSENLTDAFISEKFGSTKNLAESEIQEMIVEYAVNDSPVVAPPQDDPSWHATIIDRPLDRYIWQRTRIVYIDRETISTPVNITGANGSAPPLCSIYGENVFKYDINGQLISSPTIVLTAETIGSLISIWEYKDINEEWQVYPSPTNVEKTLTVSATDDVFVDDVAIIRCRTNIESAQDIVSITKIRDGASGYTVILSNENITFAGTVLADPSTAISLVQAYLGITALSTTVENISNIPVGMTISIQNNNSTETQLTINVDEEFTAKNGELNIPITIEGESFVKTISYSLVLNGSEGVGVESISDQYGLSESKTVPPTNWQETAPVWTINSYLWHRSKIIYTDGNIEYTEPYVDSSWEVANSKNKTFTEQPTNYQKDDLWILGEDYLSFKKGEILVANQSSEIFVADHWEKKISYTDDTLVGELDLIVRQNYSELVERDDAIRIEMESNYTSNEEFAAYQSYVSDFTSSEIEFLRTTINGDIINLEDEISSNQSLLEEYIRFKGALMELGRSDSDFTAEFDNTELRFLENGQKIAYISNSQLYITSAEIENNLRIGNISFFREENNTMSIL